MPERAGRPTRRCADGGAPAPTRLRIATLDVLTILSQDWAQMSNRQSKATPLPARNVKETIRALAAARGSIQSGLVARELGITRQAVHYHLREMVAHGELRRVGAGRGARYERVALARRYPLDGLAEDAVWREVRDEIP